MKSKSTVSESEALEQCKVYIEAEDGQACHFYMVFRPLDAWQRRRVSVLRTKGKAAILTEKLSNGTCSWVVNPTNLEVWELISGCFKGYSDGLSNVKY